MKMMCFFKPIRSAGAMAFVLASGMGMATGAPQSAGPSSGEIGSQKGEIAGQVLSLATREPLKSATLRLRKPFPTSNSAPNPRDAAYTTQTDAAGKFLFQDVDPGSYWLTTDRSGYVEQNYGANAPNKTGAVLRVEAGQALKGLVVTLVPQGTIAGKVTDDDGEPFTGGQATANVVRYMDGARRLFPVGFAEINANGGFLIGSLPPGQYYVSVKQTGPIRVGGTVETARSAPRGVYARTYYPNASEPSGAAAISVAAGAAVGGIEIRMQKSRIYRVRGKVDFAAGIAVGAKQLLALRRRASLDLSGSMDLLRAAVSADGTFEFDQVPPGGYILEPERLLSRGVLAGRAEVTVVDEDVEGVNLALFTSPNISGTVRFEAGTPEPKTSLVASPVARASSTAQSGGELLPPPPPAPLVLQGSAGQAGTASRGGGAAAPPATPSQADQARAEVTEVAEAHGSLDTGILAGVYVYLSWADGVSINPPRATSLGNGTFRLTNVPLDRYHVNVSELPSGAYIKSVLYNGDDVTVSSMDVSASGGTLEIVLSAKAGEIGGVVQDSQGKALPDVVVSAWPANVPKGEGDDHAAVTTTDQSGMFRFGNLAPGEYRVLAWEDVEDGLARHRPFCALFNSTAAKVELGEKAQERLDIKPIAMTAIAAAAARLP
jgi:hypothetical protein